jgi:chitin disaccharide deacetylase
MEPGLIVNADDLGADAATTQGIASAYEHGIVSSTSLMVTMPTAGPAVTVARTAAMPVGLHIDLTQGRAIAGPHLDRLVDEAVKLRAQDLIRIGRANTPLTDQIRAEVRAQLARAADLGLTPTHVDSHQHIHMNPALFPIWEEEAAMFGIGRIRFSREPLRFLWGAAGYTHILKRNNLSKWLEPISKLPTAVDPI